MPDSPWVFPSPKRAGLPITNLNGSHEKVLAATGLSFVLYDLRHTFATRAAERGMPLPLLAKILGHANPTQAALDAAMLRYGQSHAVPEENRRGEEKETIQ
jgi:integrase